MKKYKLIWVLGLMSLYLSSCKKFLDTTPYDKITGEQTWSSENLSTAFIYQIYTDVLSSDSWLAAYASPNSARSESSTKNAMTGTLNGPFWSKDRAELMTKNDDYGWINYNLLWRIHTAMKNIEESPKFSAEYKKRSLGELHFLRAAHYFIYAKLYGGLQIIDRELSPTENLQIPRKSIKETYDFIIADLDIASQSLPPTTERGRASSAAAYALLMRVGVQAAAYVDGGAANSVYYDKTIAAGTALGLNANGSQLSPYANMFRAYETAIASKEIILSRERSKINSSLYDTPIQYQGLWANGNFSAYAKEHFPINVTMNFWGMDGGSWPTQDLVDDYLVKDLDGSIKPWTSASYVTTGKNVDEKMYFSSTKKRDLRFYSTILYDSCMYFNNQARVFFRRDGNVSNANSKINEGSVEEYGYKAGNTENYNSSTGYAMIKYQYDQIISLPSPGDQKLDYSYAVFRYGEAYLNMAEAYLMKGDFANAKQYITATMVKHAGFEENQVTAYLAPLTGNNWGDALFEAYKRERNVEMVYENNDTYWSLMRWGMRKSGGVRNGEYASSGFVIPDLQGSLRGIRISRDGKTYSFFQDNNSAGEARFTPKRYLIPINEAFRLKSGVNQNPGWD
ncbi:RagB/SusD family nutrient uptake outer membrane protein [Pedobacter gandavensis]|uniref:RagB/SusD family nutrient uptake outer membrane protein n=1 Tax=Pedobacter gandavensis TaxID=2679963 RepID=A0ABR6EQN7_9SPHI|nr:RagB/SusD family nutrient uptake outer membrane protein [Pedobacter gandavensis]MBB2147555.1 RagB/SusD family nutrient uptake outer membrane protein [Pedobacter gandavensis]